VFSATDGRGTDEAAARSLSDSLEAYGCLLRVNAGDTFAPVGSEPPLNQNAVFDAARRLSQCVRILRRQQIVGYAVENGNSVIWVRRYAYGLSHGLPADLLKDCGPGTESLAASQLEIGQRYTVLTGRIQHRGRTYAVGQSFTPTQACTGDGTAREAEGIRSRALRGGFSRRWCLSLTFSAYHPSLSSNWKPSAFADYRSPFGNRCLFDDPDAAADKVVRRHLAFGQKPIYNEEAPSGYNYLPTPLAGSGFNASANLGATEEFFRSCQIYQPPLEISSATYEADDAGDEVVKLTLNGRLQHHHSLAPASLDRDITTWDTTDLNDESISYATDENRLRQYLVNQYLGLPCDASGPGNASFNSTIQSDPDNPQGTCYPNALLVRLIPEPYLDGNVTGEATDSPALSEHLRLCELYLRAMCEGFVDGRTSARLACESGTTTLYDFTWPNLWFSATGNRWCPLLPEDLRPDNPEGHGPIPVVGKYAATFNALVSAVNELTTVRVMLPATLEANTVTTEYRRDVTDVVRNSAGELASVDGFSTGGSSFAVWMTTGASTGAETTSESGWVSTTTGAAGTGVSLTADSSSAELLTSRVSVAWRWAVDSGVEYALPENIRSYLSTQAAVVLSVSPSKAWEIRSVVAGEDQGTQCHATGGADTVWGTGLGSASLFVSRSELEGDFCQIYTAAVEGGEPSVGDVWASEDILGPPRPGCFGATTRTVGLTAVNSETPAITIPTVAYGAGT
jgi:type II secretory pathway pseudopilin PulG